MLYASVPLVASLTLCPLAPSEELHYFVLF